MVPIHPFELLAQSTLYKPQEILHSWITHQVIPHTWESLSDTSHLDFFSLKDIQIISQNPSTKL